MRSASAPRPEIRRSFKATVWILALVSTGWAQTSVLATGRGRARGAESTLVGPLTRADLKQPPFSSWFERRYSEYQPAEDIARRLREPLASVSVEAYFGTWCGDSKRQIPRLLNILDAAGFDEARLRLVGLSDRPMEFKKAPGNPEAKRGIHRTPTVVVLRDGVELGRIVETPMATLEGDLLAIVLGHPPEPNYGAEAFVHHLLSGVEPDDAEKVLAAAEPEISRRSDPGSLWHYAEYDLLKNNRAHEARAVIELYLQVEPKSARGHVILSDALVALGRKDEALAAVEKALDLEPQNPRALGAAEALRRP